MELYKETSLNDACEGFGGETIFELSDGERWQQVEYYYTYRYKYRPSVRIYKEGSKYLMELEGIEKLVRVERL